MEKIVSRFKGKLIQIVKDSNSNFNDYSISPKTKQILLHWDDELTKKDFLLMYKNELLSIQLIMNFTKGKENCCWILFEEQRSYKRKRIHIKTCQKKKTKSIKKNDIKNWFSIKRKHSSLIKCYFAKYNNVLKIWWNSNWQRRIPQI